MAGIGKTDNIHSCHSPDDHKNDRMYSPLLRLPRSLLFTLLLLTACSGPSDVHETRFLMGTLVDYTVSGVDQDKAEQAISAAADEMQRIEDTFTIYGYQPNAVKAFNKEAPNTPVTLPDEVSYVLGIALHVQQQSGGAFDPALGGLNLLWGFSLDPPPASPPSADAIRAAVPPSHCIRRSGAQWLRTDRRCQLDFGGIAKGYAIDRGIEVLRQHGITNAIINAGGDLRLIGSHGKRPWRIGIRDPRKPGGVLAELDLKGDKSIVTSGDYERFFIYQGKRYHHILSPKTGWPAMQNQSTTVMAPSAMLADAWSTALFVNATPPERPSSVLLMRVDKAGHIHGKLQ